MGKEKCTAIVLAAGSGKRMNSSVQKQYMLLEDRPVLYYSLNAFEKAYWIDEIIVVAAKEQVHYCQTEIIDKYKIKKAVKVVAGGAERYDSVYCGLSGAAACDYVFIHDGARPFLDQDMLERIYIEVKKYNAVVPGVPVKDTIKVLDENGFVKATPDRSGLYIMQTPQTFSYPLIKKAYDQFMLNKDPSITDDAMVAEKVLGSSIKIVEGSYHNIKITTPEDMEIGKLFLHKIR